MNGKCCRGFNATSTTWLLKESTVKSFLCQIIEETSMSLDPEEKTTNGPQGVRDTHPVPISLWWACLSRGGLEARGHNRPSVPNFC